MALSRKLNNVRRTTKPRKTASETYLINVKYMGKEPIFTPGHKMSYIEHALAYNWYNMMSDTEEAREFLVTYLEETNRSEEAEQISFIPDNYLPPTICWIARMKLNGLIVPENTDEYFERVLKKTITNHTDIKASTAVVNSEKLSVAEYSRIKVIDFCSDLEDDIMAGTSFSMYDRLKAVDFPSKLTSRVRYFFEPLLDEVQGALDKSDPDLVEGYSRYTTKQLKAKVAVLSQLIDDCERYGSNTKKSKAPRQKKPLSVEKKFKHFKYKVEDEDLKIASAKVTDIVGAQEVWMYNTSMKQLTVLRALDRGGLDIKRSSIIGYDYTCSYTKRAGRNIETTITTITTGGKVALRKLMEEITSSEIELSDRSTANTIILRVVKG